MFLDRLRRRSRTSSAGKLPEFSILFSKFQQILQGNNTVLETIAQMEDKLSGEYVFDRNYIQTSCALLSETVYKIIYALSVLSNNGYPELFARYEAIQFHLSEVLDGRNTPMLSAQRVIPNDAVGADMEERVGAKSARLSEIRNRLGMKTPDGFVLTTSAYSLFMAHNQLGPKIRSVLACHGSGSISSAERGRRIEQLFDSAVVPPKLEKEIRQALRQLYKRVGRKVPLAVRSSACGEDDAGRSYAGQFRSLLNQNAQSLPAAYKQIVASRFSQSVLDYQGDTGFQEEDLPMAVACQEMVPALVSGVLYTHDPGRLSWDRCLISGVYGLGEPAVSGTAATDQFSVSRIPPFRVQEQRIGAKTTRRVLGEHQEIREEIVPEDLSLRPCLSEEQIVRLTQHAMTLERYFRQPQDVEWALSADGEFIILQTRPLVFQRDPKGRRLDLSESLRRYPVLLGNEGQVVQRGVAAGEVFRLTEDDDPDTFPQGAIAVTHFTSPRLARIVRKTSAIVTDVGSPTGHMATIAREFGVPTLVGTGRATALLETGMKITVDADENKIYQGIVPEVLEYQMEGRDLFANMQEFRMLKKVLGKVAPLNLIDPASSEFSAKNCRTYHDILRFCHEKAVGELINLHTSEKRFRNMKSTELKLPIPIGLHIIDVGHGLAEHAADRAVVSVDQIASRPMRAILEGLTAPGAWSTQAKNLRFDDFMSSLTRFSLTDSSPRYAGRNLAVISEQYTNLSLRLGYHFNVIDTYVSENLNDNYIYFRFVGGVTESERRHRRGIVIQNILEMYDFKVVLKNDLVVARLKDRGVRDMEKTLAMLGRLIGFTRQLDTDMTSTGSIERFTSAFLDGATGGNA